MSQGYRCDWCGRKPTEKERSFSPYQTEERPRYWASIQGDDVCSTCISKAKKAMGRRTLPGS